jgi:N-acetylneuraminic acid mutarotase
LKKLFTLSLILFSFFAEADYWTQKADFPGIGIDYPFSFSIGNKGYVGTGAIDAPWFTVTNEFWEYDPSANVWTQKANFGGNSRFAAIGFSIGNKGYAGLGTDSSGTYLQDFWEYDPSTNIWTQKANFGGGSRTFAMGFSIGNAGYAGTGYSSSFTADLWKYDPVADTWSQMADLSSTWRASSKGFAIGTNGYVIGGYYGTSLLSDAWEYNSITNTWSQKASFPPGGRDDATALSICDKGYFGVGESVFTTIYTDEWWQYNPLTNSWSQKTNFSGESRNETAYFSIGNKGYVGMGYGNITPFLYDFWEYTPDSACATGIEELTNDNLDFTISPNPAKDFIVINYPLTGKEKVEITVTDVAGKKVYQTKLQTTTLNFKLQTLNFPRGIYFVEVNNGKQKGVKKFLKE